MSNDYTDEMNRIEEQYLFLTNYEQELILNNKQKDTQQRYDSFLTTEIEKHNTTCQNMDDNLRNIRESLMIARTFCLDDSVDKYLIKALNILNNKIECHLVKVVIEATETLGHKEMEQDE